MDVLNKMRNVPSFEARDALLVTALVAKVCKTNKFSDQVYSHDFNRSKHLYITGSSCKI